MKRNEGMELEDIYIYIFWQTWRVVDLRCMMMWFLSFCCFWWYTRRHAGSLPDAKLAQLKDDHIWILVTRVSSSLQKIASALNWLFVGGVCDIC